ncbi:putative nucleoporin p58/p45 [Rosa chinensis]|uniref:Putative nucleoporin p58/p45 n=1 Tax=Rosa chinensis TaxID=74649 RepID=A0A2P6RN44_ROSCH|nr:nuclear pore complex protein NUP58 [Rosa chinensis]PRQ47811.1 putative nucleoporin p58/p45 [Rosa chinensis]
MSFSLFSSAQPQQTPQPQSSLFQTPSLFQTQQSPNPFQQTQQSPNPFQQSPSLFQQNQQSPSPFQQSTSLFSQPQQQQQQQQQQSPFQPQQFQSQSPLQFQPPPQQQQQQQQQLFLFTNDKTPASYGTKWADLHPDSQKILLQIEERILGYRDESQRLDQSSRLYDSSVSNDGFEQDASRIIQELGGIGTAMDRQKALLQELMATVKEMLRNSEVAVRSFMMLRPRFLRPNAGGTSNGTAASQAPGATETPGSTSQPTTTSIVPVFDFYNGVPRKPSPFLQHTIARFEKYLGECRQWIEEIEQLLLNSERNSSNDGSSLLQSLPKVMSNVHDFFVHVAAKVESIHQYIVSMKAAYLANQRRLGDGNDPFLEADRRETARQEAAAKRVHPTLHLPAISQPSTQVAGLLASSGSQAASTAPQTSAATTTASSGSAFSLFSTPSAPSSSSMASSLFATPTTPAPVSSLFGPSSATPQTSTASQLGNTAQALGSTTPVGGSLFSTPFASGPATSFGSSFGAATKSTKPKTRSGRR